MEKDIYIYYHITLFNYLEKLKQKSVLNILKKDSCKLQKYQLFDNPISICYIYTDFIKSNENQLFFI